MTGYHKLTEPLIMYYSPTGLESILECPRRRYLNKKFRKKLTWPDLAKGTHMHRKIEELRLHHLRKSMGKNNRYNSAEAFANVIANDWQQGPIKEGKIRGDVILWDEDDKSQPYRIKEEIRKIGLRIYPILIKEQEKNPPFIFTNLTKKGNINYNTSYEFEFTYKSRGFTGEIDEIRKEDDKIVIRDYKTGKWKFVEDKQEYAFQPTEYLFAVCLLSKKDETFRKILGITEEQVNSWIKEPELLSDNIIFEYFMTDLPTEWDKEKKEFVVVEENPNPIIRVERNIRHYRELCLGINAANAWQSDMKDRNYITPIKGTHCKRCFYQQECDEMTIDTDVHIRQSILSDYIGVIRRPKNYINPDSLPIKLETIQSQFDFMKEVKRARKPALHNN